MLKPGDQHLTEDELDRLAGISGPGHATSGQSAVVAPTAASHLSTCLDCRRRVEERLAMIQKLACLETLVSADRTELCPSNEEWLKVAAGLVQQDMSQTMLDHAVQCDHCGPLLKQVIQDFSDPTSPEETQIVANLKSSSLEWQKRMSNQLSASACPREQSTRMYQARWSWKLPVFACSVVALFAVLIWILLPRPERRVEKLLVTAYTERRNFEPRMPGAACAPLRIQRAVETSHLDSPPSLLEAEKEITNNLAKNPSDPFWLQSRARAELLEGNYSGAIDALREALAAKPNSPSLLVDLGTAYSQRGDATGNPQDYGQAVDVLGKALQNSPRDPVVLFNRAIISRKALLFSQTIEDWQAYLQIDPTGPWADEARSRLVEAKQEQGKRKQGSLQPLLTPSQFAALDLDQPVVIDAVDQHLETYYDTAVSQWLPLAFPIAASSSVESADARAALQKLAAISLTRHSDRWWTDLLSGSSSPLFPAALRYLSSAIQANESGSTDAAHKNAVLAVQYSRRGGWNKAAIVRANIEDLYASNLGQNADQCASRLGPLRDNPQLRLYPWLGIKYRIQEGNCQWLHENLGGALDSYSSAATQAKATNYGTILLGAQDHWSMAAGASGDYALAWRLATDGLKEFWGGNFSDVRGYNFYYSLYETARFRQEPFLEVSIWKEAIPLAESSPDLAQVAVAHSLSANSSLATQDSFEALREFERATELFARSPKTEATRLAHLEAETRLAGVETSTGQSESALSRLRLISAEVNRLSDNYLKVLFYDNFAKALVTEGDTKEAEASLRSAIRLAELQLQSVRDVKSRLEWKLRSSEPYRDLVSLLVSKGDAEGALQSWEAFKAAPARIPNLSSQESGDKAMLRNAALWQVSSYLPGLSRATLITYVIFPKQLLIWASDNRGVHFERISVSAAELLASAETFRDLCSRPGSDLVLVRHQAEHLYELLVAPIEPYLQPGRTLIVELDEGLDGLPMEALLDRNNHYLGERGPIMSSLGVLYSRQETLVLRISRETPALVVAVSAPHRDTGNQLLGLPDVVPEGQAVASMFKSAHLLIGRTATLQHTLREIPLAGVFHFAGHASNSYLTPGLLLSDSALTANSLEKLTVSSTRLVVLSACNTEAGALGSVDAPDSLVVYLVRAGIPRVVASRWDVDSGLTRRFMVEFYTQLLHGSSVEESLFEAQNALRGQVSSGHPFYWAAFTVFGAQAATT